MSLGTTSDFNLTRTELITAAFGLIGVTHPSNQEISDADKVFNSFIRHLDVRGDWFWKVDKTESSLTLVAGQSEYATGSTATTIATNIFRLEWVARYQNGSYIDLDILEDADASRTPLKSGSNSTPEAVYLDRGVTLANNVLKVFPTPASADTLKYTFRRPLFDFDTASDQADVPTELILPLQYGLAYHLAPHYRKTLEERTILKMEFESGLSYFQNQRPNNRTPTRVKAEYF